MVPLYLQSPVVNGHSYGRVLYEGRHYVVEAEPAVLEMAKRLFPGSGVSARREGCVRFPATRRAVGDLNWLLLRFPMTIECEAEFGADRDKAIEHAERRATNHVLEAAAPPATFTGELFDYQAKGVSFLIANERTLLADEMGLGKTVVALGGLSTAEAFPVLIVAPANVTRQWGHMAAAFLNVSAPGTLLGDLYHICKGLKPYELPEVPLVIIHYGLLARWAEALREIAFHAIVFDEIQELRHTGTQKYSAASSLSDGMQFVWGLSGTPVYNYGEEIWSVLNILDFNCLGSKESFSREWCMGYGTRVVEKPEVLGDYLRAEGLMLRRRKADVQSELPPKRRVTVDIRHDEGVYRKLIARAVGLARGYDGISDWSEKGQTKRMIEQDSRRATGVSKAHAVAEFVQTLVEAGERVLLFAWHHDVHDILIESLACRNDRSRMVARITGRESAAEKDESVRAFAAGEVPVVLLSLRAAAGLDGLQGRGTCVVFAELDWSPAVHSQCEDRLHRIGVEAESLLCYYLVSSTSYDDTVRSVLGLKVGQFVGIMGDDGETEADREVAERAAQRHLDGIVERLKAEA